MSQLPKEWEAIIAENTIGCAEHVCDRVRNAVSSAYALSQKPQRELTDAEISRIWHDRWDSPIHYAKLVIAAHQKKQQEPETVKFRAARRKGDSGVAMFQFPASGLPNDYWEWLEPAQEYEVTLP